MRCHGWSATIPRMVTHHPKDGHPPFKIYQKDLYYRLEIWHLDLTHKIKTMLSAIDGQPPSPGWSPTIPRKVTHNPKSTWRNCTTELKFANKTKLIKSKSGEVPWMVCHHPQDGHPPFQGWSCHFEEISNPQKYVCGRLLTFLMFAYFNQNYLDPKLFGSEFLEAHPPP